MIRLKFFIGVAAILTVFEISTQLYVLARPSPSLVHIRPTDSPRIGSIAGDDSPTGSIAGDDLPPTRGITEDDSPISAITGEDSPWMEGITGDDLPSTGSIVRDDSLPTRSIIGDDSPPTGSITGDDSPPISSIAGDDSPPISNIAGDDSPPGNIVRELSPSSTSSTGEKSPLIGSIAEDDSLPIRGIFGDDSTPTGIITGDDTPPISSIAGDDSPPISSIAGEDSPPISNIAGDDLPPGNIVRELSPSSTVSTGEKSPPIGSIAEDDSLPIRGIFGDDSTPTGIIAGDDSPSSSSSTGEKSPTTGSISGDVSPLSGNIVGEVPPTTRSSTGENTPPTGSIFVYDSSPTGSIAVNDSTPISSIAGVDLPPSRISTGEKSPSTGSISGYVSPLSGNIVGEVPPTTRSSTGENTPPTGSIFVDDSSPTGSITVDNSSPTGSIAVNDSPPISSIAGVDLPSSRISTGEKSPSTGSITGDDSLPIRNIFGDDSPSSSRSTGEKSRPTGSIVGDDSPTSGNIVGDVSTSSKSSPGENSPPTGSISVDDLPPTGSISVDDSSSTGSIPGLTPEESLDIVEKILHGELEPVIYVPTSMAAAPALAEAPSPGSESTHLKNTPQVPDPVHFTYRSQINEVPVVNEPKTVVKHSSVVDPIESPVSLIVPALPDSFDSSIPIEKVLAELITPGKLTDLHNCSDTRLYSSIVPSLQPNEERIVEQMIPVDLTDLHHVNDGSLSTRDVNQATQDNQYFHIPAPSPNVPPFMPVNEPIKEPVPLELANFRYKTPFPVLDFPETNLGIIHSPGKAFQYSPTQSSTFVDSLVPFVPSDESLEDTMSAELPYLQSLFDPHHQDVHYIPEILNIDTQNNIPAFPDRIVLSAPINEPVIDNQQIFSGSSNLPISYGWFPLPVKDLSPSTLGSQTILEPLNMNTQDDIPDLFGSRVPAASAVLEDQLVSSERAESQLGRNDAPSIIQKLPALPSQNHPTNSESSGNDLKNNKYPLNTKVENLGQVNSEIKNPVASPYPEKVETVSKGITEAPGKLILDPKIYFPKARAQPVAITTLFSPSNEITGTPKLSDFVKTPFSNFKNVDEELLALSDESDSTSDSKSLELSKEMDSDEDEFWMKMKPFMDYEGVPDLAPGVNFELTTQKGIQDLVPPTDFLLENVMPPVSLSKTPSAVQNFHTMRIPGFKTHDTEQELPLSPSSGLEETQNIEDRPSQVNEVPPVQDAEPSTLSPDNYYTTTEGSYNLNETSDIEDGDLLEYITTTEWLVEDTTFSTGKPEYDDTYTIAPETTDDYQTWNSSEWVVNTEQPRTIEDELDYLSNVTEENNFRGDTQKRSAGDYVFPNGRNVLSVDVGRSDDLRELENNPEAPEDDIRFREGNKENFTTDEPLLAEEEPPLEFARNVTSPQDQEESIMQPTDLNSIEFDNFSPALNNYNHSVSKKDDPMITLEDVTENVPSSNDTPNEDKTVDSVPNVPPIAVDTSEASFGNESTRVRRSTNDTDSLSGTASPNLESPPTSLPSPINTSVTQTTLTLSPTVSSPSTSNGNKQSQHRSSTGTTLLQGTKLPFPTTSTTAAPSVTSTLPPTTTTNAPSTTSVTLPPSSTSLPSTESPALSPSTTFEPLPTPIPETSTTLTPLTSIPASTNSTAPKKKMKKVWNIPFYPHNIAISSNGDVRLEPKDKSSKLPITTTPKPLLRNRLKPEDLEAARERLLKRFQSRRPVGIPIFNATQMQRNRLGKDNPLALMPTSTNRNSTVVYSAVPPTRPQVTEDILAYATAKNPSELPSLLYNSPEEREEARRRRLRNMLGLAGDVRSLLSDRARYAVRTVGKIVGGDGNKKESLK